MTVKCGHCIFNSFNVTNCVCQGRVLSPQLFNVYIDGLSDILNKSTIGGSLGGKRINQLLYADDLLGIVSLSSAGLQQLLSIFDLNNVLKLKLCNSSECSQNVFS